MAVNVHTYEAPDLVTKHVTVFTDRAEVKKIIPATKLTAGLNEIIVKKLTRCIESDSIRVEGFGKSVICEVKYQEKYVKQEEDQKQSEKDLRTKLNGLREDLSKLNRTFQILTKQRSVLESVATQIGSTSTSICGKDKNTAPACGLALLGDAHLENLEKFLSFYAQRSASVDTEKNNVEKQMKKLNEEIRVIEKNLDEVFCNQKYQSREVSIIVQSDQAETAEFNLTYLVSSASWTPSYDLRVSTNEKLLQVNYYGLITQDTNEDWKDVHLSLSTAMPRVGGQVPELKTLKVGFYKPAPPPPPPAPAGQRGAPMMMTCAMSERLFSERGMEMESNEMELMKTAVTDVQESVLSTSFDIPHTTTIPSDNTSHKVTIAIVGLKPSFQYETVPSKSAFAYLKAKVVNTSNYPFLPGPAAVFLDNNFVAKSSLKAVSPSEEFNCSLGVDPAVRVEYKPARKFHEETGLLTRSSVETHEQKVEIKNTKSDSITITVIEHLPLSGEEKIKIHLLEPNANRNEKGFSFKTNKNNNVEFEIVVPKNETRIALVKYSVEHPKGEQLEYNEE